MPEIECRALHVLREQQLRGRLERVGHIRKATKLPPEEETQTHEEAMSRRHQPNEIGLVQFEQVAHLVVAIKIHAKRFKLTREQLGDRVVSIDGICVHRRRGRGLLAFVVCLN
jgi:hypothetical protein